MMAKDQPETPVDQAEDLIEKKLDQFKKEPVEAEETLIIQESPVQDDPIEKDVSLNEQENTNTIDETNKNDKLESNDTDKMEMNEPKSAQDDGKEESDLKTSDSSKEQTEDKVKTDADIVQSSSSTGLTVDIMDDDEADHPVEQDSSMMEGVEASNKDDATKKVDKVEGDEVLKDQNGTVETAKAQIDRAKVLPFCVRAFIKLGAHHLEREYLNGFPAEGIVLHCWRDTTLLELAAMLQLHRTEAQQPNMRFSFRQVSRRQLRGEKFITKDMGSVSTSRTMKNDGMSLADFRFHIGDYLDIAIFVEGKDERFVTRNGRDGQQVNRSMRGNRFAPYDPPRKNSARW